jgi:hypothetical protein
MTLHKKGPFLHHAAEGALMTIKTEISELLAPADLAKLLNVSERTLANWRYKAYGPRYLKFGRSRRSLVLYPSDDLKKWLKEQARNSKNPAAL